MKDVTSNLVDQTILPVLIDLEQTADSKVSLTIVNNQYQIKDFDKKMALIEQWSNEVDHYVYSEEDRQPIKKMNAQINKLVKAIKAEEKALQQDLFGLADSQVKQINESLLALRTKLQKGLDEDDARIKLERKERLSAAFDDAKKNFDVLKNQDFTFEDVFVAAWLNRTTSESKAVDDLFNRMKTLALVIEESHIVDPDIDMVLDAVEDEHWEGLAALSLLKRREQERLDALMKEELERQAAALLAEKKQAAGNDTNVPSTDVPKKVNVDVMVKINGDDWETAERLLQAANIKFIKL